uniref:Protein-tyrosine-phosphatase n=1 Tax=Ascaris lumbricoides TaxID=6252 RepID=A0A0M3IR45_ASCLU
MAAENERSPAEPRFVVEVDDTAENAENLSAGSFPHREFNPLVARSNERKEIAFVRCKMAHQHSDMSTMLRNNPFNVSVQRYPSDKTVPLVLQVIPEMKKVL